MRFQKFVIQRNSFDQRYIKSASIVLEIAALDLDATSFALYGASLALEAASLPL
jgi:hypothetical protein